MNIFLKSFFILIVFFSGISWANYDVSVKTTAPAIVPMNAVRLPILEIDIRTNDEPLAISSLEIGRKGLSSRTDFSRIWAETESYRRTLRTRFGVDDAAKLRFSRPIFIPENSQEKIYVLANLSASFGSGKTFSFVLNGINESPSQNIIPEKIPVQTIVKQRRPRLVCKNRKCSWVKN